MYNVFIYMIHDHTEHAAEKAAGFHESKSDTAQHTQKNHHHHLVFIQGEQAPPLCDICKS